MKFDRFSFRNAGTYKKFSVDLSNLGVVFVQGENKDTGGSNGAGKSLPWDFLEAGLFSASSRGMKKDSLVRKKNHLISISFVDHKNNKCVIKHYRKHSKHGNSYVIKINNKDRTPAGGIPICEKFIKSMHGLSEAEFHGFILMTQRTLSSLIEGSGPDRLRYISSLFGLDVYDEIRDKSKEELVKVNEKIGDLNSVLDLKKETKTRLRKLKPKTTEGKYKVLRRKFECVDKKFKKLNKKVTKFEKVLILLKDIKKIKFKEAGKAQKELVVVKHKLKIINVLIDQKDQRKKARSKLKKRKGEIKELQDKVIGAKDISKKLQGIYNQLAVAKKEKKEWNEIKGKDICPTCKSKIDSSIVYKTIESISKKIISLKEKCTKLEKGQKQYNQDQKLLSLIDFKKQSIEDMEVPNKIDQSIKELKEESKKLDTLQETLTNKLVEGKRYVKLEKQLNKKGVRTSVKIPDFKNKIKKYKKELKELSSSRDVLISDKGSIKIIIKQIKMYKSDLLKYETKIKGLDKLNIKVKVLTALVKAYSTKGLKLGRINKIGETLAERLNVYAEPLFSEKFVRFTVPANDKKLDFIIQRSKSKHDIRYLSTGEKKRLAIAFILATNSMTPPNKSSNLIILDEIDAGLDSIGKEAFRTYLLPRLKRDFESVIVISHSNDIQSSDYNQNWLAVKENNVSKMIFKGKKEV